MVLPDVLIPNLSVVFCGTAVGFKSAETSCYYAGTGNKFYSILKQTNFTSRQINPLNYKKLTEFNIGLTDIAKLTKGNDSDLKHEDFDIKGFIKKIEKFQPQFVCFNGKASAAVFLFNKIKQTGKVNYGILPQTISKTKLFVAPSTSGSANSSWDESYWYELKKLVDNGK